MSILVYYLLFKNIKILFVTYPSIFLIDFPYRILQRTQV
jgi:hypothetical protein